MSVTMQVFLYTQLGNMFELKSTKAKSWISKVGKRLGKSVQLCNSKIEIIIFTSITNINRDMEFSERKKLLWQFSKHFQESFGGKKWLECADVQFSWLMQSHRLDTGRLLAEADHDRDHLILQTETVVCDEEWAWLGPVLGGNTALIKPKPLVLATSDWLWSPLSTRHDLGGDWLCTLKVPKPIRYLIVLHSLTFLNLAMSVL